MKNKNKIVDVTIDPPVIADTKKTVNSVKTRGIQTMIRVINDNHVEFSNMSDNKANILISVNAIIISIILTVMLRRLEVDPHLTIPTLLFLATSLTTIILAILATRPKVTSGLFNREDILARKVNLMYFGNFHKSTVEDFEFGVREMMTDPEYLYGNMIKDVYYHGSVLARKFRLVNIAYTIFMSGLILSIVGYVLAILLAKPPATGPTPL
jgi:hypothetical protein